MSETSLFLKVVEGVNMKRILIVMFLLIVPLGTSGCLLGFAAAVRWDQRRYNRQQAEKKRKAAEALLAPGGEAQPPVLPRGLGQDSVATHEH